ncbi:hypothetical protein [Kosakonia pseudosacchari]|uniref:hypothetical protein n=1 Tax=Kosakonia pseudosacchari TaxID=1646340 RepID=UPI0018811C12|nr:hypothetical protein [Kosakonia pseudosacchari]QOV64458.1 hypothetical protein IP581_01925 [Kosakonia pseudosacchari]WBU48991.1 hypothetical protein PF050_21520 [Kosakonia pseudosacchari]
MQVYARFTPWIDADLLNTWHQDTAFHTALIRSIINWGYPSVGLDGHPLTTYHLLSHYIDAALISISGIDAYDGYGFMVYTKALMLSLTCISFVSSLSKNRNFTLWGSIIFTPAFIGTWHAIGSHALWATSFLLIMISLKTYAILLKEKTNIFDYLFLTFVAILLCAGKLSTGFAFICIYYSVLFLKDSRSLRFYISCISLLIFLFFYQKFFNYSYGINSTINFSNINFKSFSTFIAEDNKYKNSFIVFSVVYFGIYLLSKKKIAMQMLFSTLTTIFTIYIITNIFSGFGYSDKYYFAQGYFSVMIVIAFMLCSNYYNNFALQSPEKNIESKKLLGTLTVLSSLFITSFFFLPISTIQKLTPGNLNKILTTALISPYKTISNISENKYNLFHEPKKEEYSTLKESGEIYNFYTQIKKYMDDNKIEKKDVAIFIPRDTAEKEFISKINAGQKKFYAMNLYAMTGIQMIHSIQEKALGYGFKNYDSNSIMTNSVVYSDECKRLKLAVIFELIQTEKLHVVPHKCG